MGCGSCSTGACGSVAAESTIQSNTNGKCSSGGCSKMNSFDWLGNMDLPGETSFNIVEVKFKGGRKEFFRNINNLDLTTGDSVVVEVQNGYHLGFVALQGELVRLQMIKKNIKDDDKVKQIYRKASEKDLEKFEKVKKRELPTMFRTREIIQNQKLQMKLSDVEFQADNTKATFYYSADERVDFRELIKIIAGEFKIRVEMRQISLRQEASRIGGLGSCGRELCCSTWLTDFKSVSTGAARYQNLSLNPHKLSGQCGRLKCCLNYELETYMDALVDIPKIEKPLLFSKGKALLQKVDIFKKVMWFCIEGENSWFSLNVIEVKGAIDTNKAGKPVEFFKVEEEIKTLDFESKLNDTLPKKNSNQKKRSNKKRRRNRKNKPKPPKK